MNIPVEASPEDIRPSYAEMVGCRCGCRVKPYLRDSLKRRGGIMSERIIIERTVERDPGRELIYWTVRDNATGYLKDCRSEEEANEHAAYLKARANQHVFTVVEYANRQGSRIIAALAKDGSWDVLCLTEPGHIHQFTWTQDELEFDIGDAEVVERTV